MVSTRHLLHSSRDYQGLRVQIRISQKSAQTSRHAVLLISRCHVRSSGKGPAQHVIRFWKGNPSWLSLVQWGWLRQHQRKLAVGAHSHWRHITFGNSQQTGKQIKNVPVFSFFYLPFSLEWFLLVECKSKSATRVSGIHSLQNFNLSVTKESQDKKICTWKKEHRRVSQQVYPFGALRILQVFDFSCHQERTTSSA